MHRPLTCRVVRGALLADRADRLAGLTATPTPAGDTVLTGQLPDQTARHAGTTRIRDLGQELASLTADAGQE